MTDGGRTSTDEPTRRSWKTGTEPGPEEDGGPRTRQDRGQLLLVGAVAVAIALLGVAVLFNATIYTESVPDRGTIAASHDAEGYIEAVRQDTARLMGVLGTDGSVGTAELRGNLTTYNRRLQEVVADGKPAYIQVSLNETDSDTDQLIVQDAPEDFRSVDGDAGWSLVDAANATNVTSFGMTVDQVDASDRFELNASSTTTDDWWELAVYRDAGGDVVVETTTDDGGASTCTVGSIPVTLNETGVVGGGCSYAFADGVSGPYTLTFDGGQHAQGTYRIAVNGSVPTGNLSPDGSDSPSLETVIVAASVDLVYETPDVSVRTTIDDVEPLAPADGPTVTTLLDDGFEGGLGAWQEIGSVDTFTQSVYSDQGAAATIAGDDGDASGLRTAASYDTSAYDEVTVEAWVKAGGGSDHPEEYDGEYFYVQYRDDGGAWEAIREFDSYSQGEEFTVSATITDPDAFHDDFALRLVRNEADHRNDEWHVDSVVVVGREVP
ncbi:DUF7261 family protein [Halorarum halobium]|uniref:DUF7261 family protein n=1 Tax=Halorarum halobium TaxID=3075121 RepID=UPI0028B136F2|nr:hypothetical protein [Halobaculum sp. XH14]